MDQHSIAKPPLRARWTPAAQRTFLRALADTGSVARAAQAAGLSRSGAQRLRRRLAGTPFDRDWAAALEYHAHRLDDPMAEGRRSAASRARA